MNREKEIIKVSSIGIGANVLLAGFKAGIGLLSGSIAIVLDAVNNLSDALSSIITIIGAKLSSRRPNKNHPLGYGRIEYISATIISLIVLIAGLTSLKESIGAIINGTETHYGWAAFVVMIAAVIAKLLLGHYTKKMGKRTQSQSLIASGTDATFDALITTSTIVSAFIMVLWNVNIDGWLGAIISLVIIKAGIDLIKETLNDLLGSRMNSEMTTRLKTLIVKYPNVRGAYDMVLHNYGPEFTIGSVNIEVPADMSAGEIYKLTRRMQNEIFTQEHVALVFAIYAISDDPQTIAKREIVVKTLKDEHDVLQIHAFFVEENAKTIYFDVVASFNVKDMGAFHNHLLQKVRQAIPGYKIVIQLEYDVSD